MEVLRNKYKIVQKISRLSYLTVADPETSEGEPRNMKYKPLHLAAIFLAYFY